MILILRVFNVPELGPTANTKGVAAETCAALTYCFGVVPVAVIVAAKLVAVNKSNAAPVSAAVRVVSNFIFHSNSNLKIDY